MATLLELRDEMFITARRLLGRDLAAGERARPSGHSQRDRTVEKMIAINNAS